MKLEKLVGERFKERPADCVVDSHALMIRGGYMKYVANGIYSSYLPLRRITRKIEQIHPGRDGRHRRPGGTVSGGAARFPLAGIRPV